MISPTTFGNAELDSTTACMKDDDDDGYGDIRIFEGIADGSDCNDDAVSIHPNASEIGWDGVDQDCSGFDNRPFSTLASGYQFMCGLTPSGEIECWGRNVNNQLDAPSGSFLQVTAGVQHAYCLGWRW